MIHARYSYALSSDLIHNLVDKLDSEQLRLENLRMSYVRSVSKNVLEIETSSIREYFETYWDYIVKFNPFYFDQNEIKKVNQKIVSTEEKTRLHFVNALSECPYGKKAWKTYENLCMKILTYLFVPPLLQPIVQSCTKNGFHRRDIIIRIPYDTTGFWKTYSKPTFFRSTNC